MASNTEKSFLDKWRENPRGFFDETLREGSDTQNWILSRNGFDSPEALRRYLSGKRRVLDAGCGNGRVTALLRRLSSPQATEIVGIDLVGADTARRNLAGEGNVRFETRDLLGDLSGLGSFDFIYSQEVLHHTADPARAFSSLCGLLAPGGEIAIYVYRSKAPAREFVDDYVREKISGLPYEEASAHCREITELGRALSESGARVKVPAVRVLGIEAGEYDVQRFVYHFFAKCYWNPQVSFQENVMINYDWYHPQNASRHTLQEVEGWFARAGLEVVQRHVDFYGITVRGWRPAG
ncbi:MAG: class I SAM-dependent methyltransferase [Betaproteobacteria bacterium]|nr:class I SAM-dependent methyltransferase [Betaproteobacteria bacterium]